MEISDFEYLQSTVGSINQETEILDVDCGCDEASDDVGMEILDSKISRTITCAVKKNDDAMVNSMNNNTRVATNKEMQLLIQWVWGMVSLIIQVVVIMSNSTPAVIILTFLRLSLLEV